MSVIKSSTSPHTAVPSSGVSSSEGEGKRMVWFTISGWIGEKNKQSGHKNHHQYHHHQLHPHQSSSSFNQQSFLFLFFLPSFLPSHLTFPPSYCYSNLLLLLTPIPIQIVHLCSSGWMRRDEREEKKKQFPLYRFCFDHFCCLIHVFFSFSC